MPGRIMCRQRRAFDAETSTRLLLILLLVLCVPVVGSPAFAERQTVRLGARYYVIDLPDHPVSAPVLVALHGGGGNPAQFARASGLGAPALADGYAMIWPAGTSRAGLFLAWNAGYCCGVAAQNGVDDLGFLDAVLADAVDRFGLDGDRVYLTGMSNGAMMAQRFAAARPGRVRAVAGVAGTMDLAQPVQGPVPLLLIHGTADATVPIGGGLGGNTRAPTDFSALDAVIAAFAAKVRGRLAEDAQVIDPEPDGMRVVQTDWTDRAGRVWIRRLVVEGGGHTWPGGRRAPRQGGTADIMANAEILHFFSLHP